MEIKSNREKTTELTEREKLIIKYIAAGWTDDAISNEIGCATPTVRQSVSRILQKTDVFNRPALIFWACKNGLM